MTERVVLVTGASGFVGSAVVQRLVQQGVPVRVLVHRAEVPSGVGVESVRGDLVRCGSVRGLCDGVGAVLHLAARIGGTQEECRAVNVEGTRALLAEAERAGVRRIVQLGTAAVYRDGAHRGAVEGELAEEPESVTSVTRLVGERMVLAAGGAVVRPHLVYGRGDRWVVPSLVRLLARLPHWVDGGRARMSMVSVDALAGAIAELAVREEGVGGVLHAGHPEPVSARELVGTVARELGLPLPRGEVDLSGALELLGGPEGPDPVVRRQVSLFAVDHWYDSGRLWGQLAASPGARFSQAFGQYADWYRGAERMRRR
ncbi:NAD-dependent epimerase/dehydratase family protein [Streptomyces sp. NBC_00105]|uniref:NAD-dependent epimerase/dehydratase family protein n=1 Tax=unclassified Streptomyces TaxID=2593676 RepID=UPI0028839EC9|nr:NAD-dependent epimerase/dehydratase family protein [Streptomyces sp. DSM 41633]